ncbi:MAG: hypothetical protein IJL04_00430 [Bacteroidales bacterium]|nr:hypothetical protein [Bacteroidales bacterium]MBQ6100740.1 hypothetical protein [Bacteroidales bacterium]
MKTEIQPQDSNRSEAFHLWMSSPMPMVTLVKTMDVHRLVKVSRKSGIKFTTMMCWCIGKAASQVEEFFMLPEGEYRKSLFRTTLPVSFQFHHVQMDGGQGARFLDELQKNINAL